ncbi:glycosyltransferase family 2 protein [Diaphorobacter nitroreducens]|uniref:glycosyltransferase family 2 protein n=1 Tax=Diaphorobacter nitroreducens TaxID=164759 RepID=UPI00289DD8FB|nr:glycosyltransferase family 2 protein [Diaphorobacter nitroreducens]
MTTRLAIVVPCYNEEEALPETNKRLLALLDRMQTNGVISADSAIHYIDDGSRDKTWPLIKTLAATDTRVHGIKLSRNRGHQTALLAGLLTAEGDALVSIDADLQDDVNVIEKMVAEFAAGAEVVYGVRDSRAADTAFKRHTALAYYGLMRKMGVDLVHNHADFRLMGRRAIEALREYGEVNMFLRGIVPLIGYRAATVKYDRAERFAGVSKYTLRKMLTFALEGVTSFSVVPLRLITLLGFLVSVFSFLMILFIVYGAVVLKAVVPGWASSVVPIYFLGGIQLLSMGIIGEYVAKIYMEAKGRPRFFIEKTI